MAKIVTAAVILIGDELLSGRTQDTNLKAIADYLAPIGVAVREARVVSDDQVAIMTAVNELRAKHTYVFTTGGIGPTHDDITADCVAAAFGVKIDVRADALAILEKHYAAQGTEINEGRRRMARIPEGAELILNPVSAAPGFRLHNVFVMAGVPQVMRGMLQNLSGMIAGGQVVRSHTVRGAGIKEGDIAAPLAALAKTLPSVAFGSYPWMKPGKRGQNDFGVNLVARGTDADAIASAIAALTDLVKSQGAKPQIDPKD